MQCYIASGWFNDVQMIEIVEIERILESLAFRIFSPRLHNLCEPNASEEKKKEVFKNNINAIIDADFVVVNTRDKDMGTIFDAATAYHYGRPIIYFCNGLKGGFNLMLAQSGIAVATSFKQLEDILETVAFEGIAAVSDKYKGEIE